MKKRALAAAVVCFGVAGSAAMAADIPVSAAGAPPPWPRTWDWTGFYGGLNAGYSWGTGRNIWNITNLDFSVTGADTDKPNGPLGGLQVGWNWQASYFLFGIEADIDYAGQTGKQTFNSAFTVPGNVPLIGTISIPHSQTLNWIGTVRGRLGFAVNRVLIYGTGGLAWAHGREQFIGTATATGSGSTAPFSNDTPNTVMVGWTAGAGAEIAIANNWAFRAEYLYVDLGTTTRTSPTLAAFTAPQVPAGTITISTKTTDNIVRLGVNYKFAPF